MRTYSLMRIAEPPTGARICLAALEPNVPKHTPLVFPSENEKIVLGEPSASKKILPENKPSTIGSRHTTAVIYAGSTQPRGPEHLSLGV